MINRTAFYDWGHLEWDDSTSADIYNKLGSRIGVFSPETGAIITHEGLYREPGIFPPLNSSNDYWLKKFATTEGRDLAEKDLY